MNFEDYIGYPLDYVKTELKSKNIEYKVIESSEIQKNYDTILVVRITQKDGFVEIITDKFLLNI